MRTYLHAHPGVTMGTIELAYAVLGLDTAHDGRPAKGTPDHKAAGEVSKILAKMAPYMVTHATHDGEEIIRYGRKWRRWQWHYRPME